MQASGNPQNARPDLALFFEDARPAARNFFISGEAVGGEFDGLAFRVAIEEIEVAVIGDEDTSTYSFKYLVT